MTGPDAFDDTSADHEQFEAKLIAHDQDAARVTTADVDHERARQLVSDLADADIIIPIAEKRVFIHEPSREAFESVIQLAVFHPDRFCRTNSRVALRSVTKHHDSRSMTSCIVVGFGRWGQRSAAAKRR